MSALRSRRAEVFGTSIKTGANAYLWLGTSKEFKDFTFGCERTDAGWLWYHGYQFARGASTVIVECADATWRGLGLDVLDDSAGLKMLADVFRRHLDGAPLLNGRPGQHPARWSHFPTLTNERWYDGRVVLLGDSAHTAHYSIGSGTRLALEDAIALGNALSAPGLDLAGALRRYADERRPEVARWQAEAAASASWFESMDEHLTHGPMDVAHALLRRRHPGAAAAPSARSTGRPGTTACSTPPRTRRFGRPGGWSAPPGGGARRPDSADGRLSDTSGTAGPPVACGGVRGRKRRSPRRRRRRSRCPSGSARGPPGRARSSRASP